MNKRLKAKWVKALRSGKFRQGRFTLKDSYGGYCCLGVLACNLPKRLQEKYAFQEGTNGITLAQPCDRGPVIVNNVLPDDLREEIGIPANTPLVAMNDHGSSFFVIATWIEENL